MKITDILNITKLKHKYLYFTLAFIFVIEVIPIFSIDSLTVDSSEYNIIAIAAGMSGLDWKSTINSNYYFGYLTSILYFFAFLFKPLLKSPVLLYQSFLFINVCLSVFTTFLLYKLLLIINKHCLNEKLIAAICIVASMLMSKLTLSKSATNENFYILFYYPVFLIILLNILKKENGTKHSILIALSLVGACANNNRGLILVIIVFVTYFLFRLVKKERIIKIIPFCITLVLAYILHMILKNYFVINFFQNPEQMNNDNPSGLFHNLIKLLNFSGMKMIFMCTIGWIYNFFITTYGIGSIFIVISVMVVKDFFFNKVKKFTDLEHCTVIMSLGFLMGSILLGCLFYYNSFYDMLNFIDSKLAVTRVDKLIYGRYISTIKPIIVSFTLFFMFKYNKLKLKKIGRYACLLMYFFCKTASVYIGTRMDGKRYASTDIGEFAIFLQNFQKNPKYGIAEQNIIYFISLLFIIMLIMIVILWVKNNKRLLMSIIMSVHLIIYYFIISICVIPKSDYYYGLVDNNLVNCIEYISGVHEETPIYINSNAYLYQFNCPDANIRPLNWEKVVMDNNYLIKMNQVNENLKNVSDIYKIEQSNLYAVGSDIKNYLISGGYSLELIEWENNK